MTRVHYTECPVCSSSSIQFALSVKDHLVSNESFEVWQCDLCAHRFTQDVPDEESIAPYYKSEDYISHTNTNKSLLSKVYQVVRNRTLAQKANLIINYTKSTGHVLDFGSGTGAFLKVMQERKWDVMGIEPDKGARDKAKELYNLELKETSSFYQLSGAYDAITLWHVLEHVHTLHQCVEKLKDLLTKNGKIFIAVPNYTSGDSVIYNNHWAAYDVPRHLYHFSPLSVEELMNRHGLKIIGKKRMWYDSFYISLLSSKYKGGATAWIAAAINGIRSNLKAVFDKDKCSSIIYIIEKS